MREELWNCLNNSATSGRWHSAYKSLSDERRRETTIAVVSLNPNVAETLPEIGVEILRAWGFTDLYQIFLYTRVGDIHEFPEILESDPVSARQIWNFHDIAKRADRFVLAVGPMAEAEIENLIGLRLERVKGEISAANPGAEFFRFGDPFRHSTPKTFAEFSSMDDLIAI